MAEAPLLESLESLSLSGVITLESIATSLLHFSECCKNREVARECPIVSFVGNQKCGQV